MTIRKHQGTAVALDPDTEYPIHAGISRNEVSRSIFYGDEHYFFFLKREKIYVSFGDSYDLLNEAVATAGVEGDAVNWFDVIGTANGVFVYLVLNTSRSSYPHIYSFDRATKKITPIVASNIVENIQGERIAVAFDEAKNQYAMLIHGNDIAKFYYASTHEFTTIDACAGLQITQISEPEINDSYNDGYFEFVCVSAGNIRYDSIPYYIICTPMVITPISGTSIVAQSSNATWTHTHVYGSEQVMVFAFDGLDNQIEITTAEISDDNTVTITWGTPIAGKSVVIPINNSSSSFSTASWVYPHGHSNADIFVQCFGPGNFLINPASIIIDATNITCDWGAPSDGRIHVVYANALMDVTPDASIWEKTDLSSHSLWLTQYYGPGGEQMIPTLVTSLSTGVHTEFNIAVSGRVIFEEVDE